MNGLVMQAQVDSLSQKIEETNLEELVITGQFEPQSIKKSVHNVRVISKADIENLAANNLGDVLTQYLNISVSSNEQTGRSSVSLFGLDSQYFKILIDNIPVVSDTGLGTNVDLSQINLNNVERIEIIEGAMGVTHGANAVSGILNIITKKNSKYDWELSASIQEETVGKEYDLFDKGKHIQNFKVSHNFLNNWYVSVGANRSDLRGFYNGREGKDYAVNDGNRGVDQLPKEQLITNTTIGYQKNETRVFYKFDFLDETISYFNPVVVPVSNYPFPDTYYSRDKRFITNRFFHHLNYYGKLFNDLTFNISLSHQKQQRDEELFNYYILDKNEVDNKKYVSYSKEVFYSTGNITNFTKSKYFDFQLGYEFVNDNSFANGSNGTFIDENKQIVNIRERIENYDIYALAEINFTEKLSMRTGFRYSFQSKFDDQKSYSLGARYLFNKGIEARLSSGLSFRTPNFDELYTYMVDSNHNIQGNRDLIPEKSNYTEASIKKNTTFKSGLTMYNSLSSGLMFVDDRISLLLTAKDPILTYKYINVNDYKMWNISSDNQIGYNNWNLSVGVALRGISQRIDTGALETSSDDKFFYSLNFNTALSYNWEKYKTLFALYLKHNGKIQQFEVNPQDNSKFQLSTLSSYDMLDFTVRRLFFKDKFEAMVGVRNLLDVTTLQSTSSSGIGGSAHATSPNNLTLGYGRSYFVKLTYNLNF